MFERTTFARNTKSAFLAGRSIVFFQIGILKEKNDLTREN
jgi:hypothetical protein